MTSMKEIRKAENFTNVILKICLFNQLTHNYECSEDTLGKVAGITFVLGLLGKIRNDS